MNAIREPAVAGSFYPGDAGVLTDTVTALLDAVDDRGGQAPKALIVPHAGYIYSGPTAAAGYSRLRSFSSRYERVVLLGPCHRVPISGLAVSGADAFRTPVGDISLDRAAIAALDLPVVEAAHRHEHSLEVHLPFLQAVLDSFRLIPIVVGDASSEAVADVLEQLWDGPETLFVVSTDLSHYLPYEAARERDEKTAAAIERLEPGCIGHQDACGAAPLGGLLLAARRHGLEVEAVDLRNSGDTAGDKWQVVGYGAWVLAEGQPSGSRGYASSKA